MPGTPPQRLEYKDAAQNAISANFEGIVAKRAATQTVYDVIDAKDSIYSSRI